MRFRQGAGLDLELQDDTGRLRSFPEIKSRFQNLAGVLPGTSLTEAERGRPIFVADSGGSQYLPVRVARQERVLQHETVLSARVSRRLVEVIERTTFSVRYGDLTSVLFRVPAEIADRWELLDRQEAEIRELGREADGSRRYRLSFDRAVLDQVSVRFRYRLPLLSELETRAAREVTIKRITIEEGQAGAMRVGLELDPEIVVGGTGPGWIRASDDLRAEPASEHLLLQFVEEGPPVRGRPFMFKVRALAQLAASAARDSAALDQDDSGNGRFEANNLAVLGRAAWSRVSVRTCRGAGMDRGSDRWANCGTSGL